MSSRFRYVAAALLGLANLLAWTASARATPPVPIKHVIIIMQENRSFDSYFGTYPGANGIPAGVCLPLSLTNPTQGCVVPFHDPNDVNAGGSHTPMGAKGDIDDGITTAKEDGYVADQIQSLAHCISSPDNSNCTASRDGVLRHDVAGFHDAREIPNYWAYARNFVLQDQMYAGVRSWSLPAHLDMTSEWVARCPDQTNAWTCITAPTLPQPTKNTEFPWANLFQLLDAHNVSWKYYLANGYEPDCRDDQIACAPQIQETVVPGIWNPAPFYGYVKQQGSKYLAVHDVSVEQFAKDIKRHQLAQVSWIIPNSTYSEHPPSGITTGMEYVTSLVNTVMLSPYWKDTAIFISWDDWGGFYDHVPPPNLDSNNTTNVPVQGFGIRVPGLLVSAWAKKGHIDHAVLNTDSYATFIENLFMDGARLDPAVLGNPDHRPDIRDELTSVTFLNGRTAPMGDLADEFDFTQRPLPPLLLSTYIPTGISATCNENTDAVCQSNSVRITWNSMTAGAVTETFTYHVLRNDVEIAPCTGEATSCVDGPGTGTHVYRVYSVDSKGNRSPNSAGATVTQP